MHPTVVNIIRNAIRPGYFGTMAHKLVLRASGVFRHEDSAATRSWCEKHVQDAAHFARSMDSILWDEAEAFGEAFAESATKKTSSLGVRLGGGGHYPLAYFLTRLYRPAVTVETGVAAGYTSAAILAAMDRNGTGHLYSSDFPYFRLAEPEKYVGCLVEEPLKTRWSLYVNGDRANIPAILAQVGQIDFFHYDSDKSYAGRRWAMQAISSRLAPRSIVLMDDVQDNRYFRDFVERADVPFRIFGFEGKYLGAVGL